MYSSFISNQYIMAICFNMVIDLVLVIRLRKTQGFGPQEQWIIKLLIVGMVCSVSDILCLALSPAQAGLAFYLVNCLFYYAFVGSTLLILNYSLDVFGWKMKDRTIESVLKAIPMVLITIGMISSYWTHTIFYVDASGAYQRGPLYLTFYVVCCSYIFALAIFSAVVWVKKRSGKGSFVNPAAFAFAIVLGTTLQVFIPSVPLSNMGLTMAFLLVFMNNQEKIINRNRDERDRILRQHNEEQKAQIEEITTLNAELEERQAQLEELSAEQEANLKEMTVLNAELEDAKIAAQQANIAKTSFLFNMSHDIRTPMNAIIGFTDLMERYGDDAERRRDYLHKIRGSNTVLLGIINNVLDMARIESGVAEVAETAWSAEQFNDSLFSVFYEMMAAKDIEFTREISVEHPFVLCDATKTSQIFNNILSNACKYTEPGGKVSMLLEEIPSEREGYACYRTTISDTGIGMSKEFLPAIFDEFSRERTTTESNVEGTGLGMPIVKRMVELLGGTIEVESELGVGTTFVVTLHHPIANREDLTGQDISEALHADFSGKRILLAEDNDLNAEIALEILGEAGFAVERAEDGAAAVERLAGAPAGHFDVVLMDVQMPNMNGYEATRAIRALHDPVIAQTPILAMTANAFEEDKRRAAEAGMDGHLAKPIDVAELLRTLAKMLW